MTDSAHGLLDGNRIILGAASFNGVSWAADTEFTVTVVNTNSYTFEASGAATSSGSSVGGTVSYKYLLNPGQTNSVFEYGWGVGTWNTARDSSEGWNVPFSAAGIEVDARTWQFDIFGEDLVASVNGHPLIQWDASNGVANRAFFIDDTYTSDSATPNTTRGVIVSTPDRHLVALGADDPLTVAFASQETTNTWTAAVNQHRWFTEADRWLKDCGRTENARPDSNLDRHRSTLNDLPWTAVHLWLQGTGYGLRIVWSPVCRRSWRHRVLDGY